MPASPASLPVARHYKPGEVVPESSLKGKASEAFFTVQPIPDTIFALMQGKSYKAQCPVRRSELRYVRCLHRNLEGQALVGELVVNRAIAADVAAIVRRWQEAVVGLDKQVYEDAKKEFSLTSMTGFGADGSRKEQEEDFEQVRGVFEANPFVTAVLDHIRVKTALGNELLERLGN